MHIGLARRGYSPTGGAENYLRRLGVALATDGHHSTLFASPEWPRDQWPAESGFVTIDGKRPAAFARNLEKVAPRTPCDLLFSLERVRRCDCYRAGDGVHLAWLERRASTEPAWQTRLRRWNPKHRELLALENALFGQRGARFVIANSQLVRREITEYYPSYPPEWIEVVYNGLPSSHFKRPPDSARERSRSSLALEPDDLVLLFAGTGWARKGLACALDAVAGLPDVPRPRLLVAGKGSPSPFLRRADRRTADRRTADRVRFLGPVRDMASVYAAADVFVLPTIYDPFSNACLEALAAGLPVLTTRANGFAEVLTPGVDGDVFDTGDSEALAHLIVQWSDPSRRAAARPFCAKKAAAFPIERNVAETLNILTRLSSNSPSSTR